MSKKANKVLPGIRFSEFENKEEWKRFELKSVAELIDERAGSNLFVTMSVNSGVGLISQKEKFGREIAGNQYRNYYVLRKWDFAYNKSATKVYPEGYISILNDLDAAAVPNSIFTCFRVNKAIIYPPFLNYLFHDNFHGRWLRKFIEVGARAHGSLNIDNDVLMELPILAPTIKEQQKIASCLSSLDELIAAETQKLEALQTHKKGLLDQLFPTKGEKVPKLRFKKFKNDKDWTEKSLGSIGKFTGGGTPSKENNSYWRGSIPWVSSSDIFEDSIHRIKITRFITHEALENSATKIVPQNSILLVSRVGVGKLAITKQSVCTSQDFTSFTPDRDNLIFLAYYLKSYSEKLVAFSQGMGIKGFTKDDISKLKLFLPESKDEQSEIAESLSYLDELITNQKEKLQNLKAHKKGLLQQMFPNAK